MDSFTLRPTPKIDFTQFVEHTPATVRELADFRFSLNTSLITMEFIIEFIQFTNLEPSIYRLTENLNLTKFEL
jgi:hypothetical protein